MYFLPKFIESNFQIVGIVLCVVYRRQADDGVRTGLTQTITNSYTTSDYRDPITLTWDLVMSNMECCGVNNYTDFLAARKFIAAAREEGIGRKVPEACEDNGGIVQKVTGLGARSKTLYR